MSDQELDHDKFVALAREMKPYSLRVQIRRRSFVGRMLYAPKLWLAHYRVFVTRHNWQTAAYLATFFMLNFLREEL